MSHHPFFICALKSPLALLKGNASFYKWMGLYTTSAFIIFSGLSALILANQAAIQAAFFTYFFPESWHSIADTLMRFFFEAQTKVVLASMIISGALVVTSVLLFPIKEQCSAVLETCISNEPKPKDFPLWLQALEESKLLVLYVAVQAVILAIGYYPYAWSKGLSSILGMLFLFFSFGLDFIAPALQRHRTRYITITQLLLKHGFTTLLFGALFSAPVLILGQALLGQSILGFEGLSNNPFTQKPFTLIEISSILFLVNIIFMSVAVPAGTQLALKLKPQLTTLPTLTLKTQKIVYATVAATFALGVSFHTLVARSLHHKSQILKCNYSVDWNSITGNFEGFKEVFFGKKNAALNFDIRIQNPTVFNVYIEKSRLVVKQNNVIVSDTRLNALDVPSQSTVTQNVALDAKFDLNNVNLGNLSLSGLTQLKEGWSAYIEFELLPGIPFIVEIL